MWKWINSWQVTVLISLWQTHAETVKLWYNRSISKVQTKCLSQLKNMGKSTDCLQFQHLHVYKNQSWVCKDQWIMVMPVHLSKAMHQHLNWLSLQTKRCQWKWFFGIATLRLLKQPGVLCFGRMMHFQYFLLIHHEQLLSLL